MTGLDIYVFYGLELKVNNNSLKLIEVKNIITEGLVPV